MKKWFVAIYLLGGHKKGISSYQLAKDIKVTQKSAWFMEHRIRFALANGGFAMSGTVQADELFVGGKNKNRHADKKVEQSQGRSFKDKTAVVGLYQQGESEIIERPHKKDARKTVKEKVILKQSMVTAQVSIDTKRESIQPIVLANVKHGSVLVSDEWMGYNGMNKYYDHRIVDHRAKEYVNANGDTSNGIEGFWSHFKRSIIGIYHHVSREHYRTM